MYRIGAITVTVHSIDESVQLVKCTVTVILYNYARQSPLVRSDASGLSSETNNFSPVPPSNQMCYVPPDHCVFVLQVGPGGACVYDCGAFKIFDAPRPSGGCYMSVFQGNGRMLNDN